MIRLLLIAETLGVGGTERSIVNILPSLQRKGYACEVACLRAPYTLASEIEQMGIPVHRMNLSFFWNVPEGVFKLTRLLWKKKYSVLYSYVFFPSNYLALSRLFSPGGFRVVCFGCLEFERDQFRSLWMRFRKILRIFLMKHGMDGRLAVSNPIAAHYLQYMGAKDIVVVPNAVSSFAFEFKATEKRVTTREKYGLSVDDFILITPARFIREKGHTYLIQAVKELAVRGIKLKVLFFGDGELEEEIRQQVKNADLEETIFLHPSLSQTDLFQAITSSDLFVLPSVSEGFGLAIAEAAALRIPIISTRIGGIPDVVENEKSALLVPSKDPLGLAEAIARMVNDKDLREKLSENALTHVRQKFNSDAVTEQMHRYFSGYAEKNGVKRGFLDLFQN